MSHPRRIEVMDGNSPPLGVHARAEHTRRAEQHTHRPGVHGIYHRLPSLVGLALLYEADFACWDAVVLHQFALDFGVHAPTTSGLVRAQIRKDELRAFLRVVLAVILRYHLGAMARLVVGVVLVVRVNHAHVQCHFPCIVRGDEHLRLLLRFRERRSAQYRRVARLGELHQLPDKHLLVRGGRYVVQYLVLLRTVHANVLRRAVVGYLVVERRQLRHLDEVAEAFLLHDVVRHVELEIGRLLGEDGSPCVEAADVLFLQRLRAQVFEQQVQFRQRVADGRARQERRPQVPARPFLYGADGEQQVQRLLASLGVAQPRHTVMARVERQVLELVT